MSATEATQLRSGPVVDLVALQGAPDTERARDGRTAPDHTRHFILRRLDPWSVFKLSLFFYLCVSAVLLVAGIVLWLGASVTGVVGNVESFLREAGFDDFQFRPVQLLRAFTVGGLIVVVAGTVATMLLATLFNLISELVGGIRLTLVSDPEPASPRH